MAILAVKMTKKLQSVSNIFVLNLCVCDLLSVVLVLPFNIYTYLIDGAHFNLVSGLCKFVGFSGYALTGTTIITITLIAWNRYKMVTGLAEYKRIFTAWNICIMLTIAWIAPVVILLPGAFGIWGQLGYEPTLMTCNLLLSQNSRSFRLFILIFRAVIPGILIVYFYATIYRTTRARHRRLSRSVILHDSMMNRHIRRNEMHLTKMVIIVSVVFVMSYFPCIFTSIIDWHMVLSKEFQMFCSIFVYISSAANPLIYGLMNTQFRKAYIKLATCKRERKSAIFLYQKSSSTTRDTETNKISKQVLP